MLAHQHGHVADVRHFEHELEHEFEEAVAQVFAAT
eukprot:CAMPEP_0175087258 /NCGR_PEP_ID=MMETSP0052_2-20121109/29731_1 /TAXON_ID=51329 ORGANISM="Polytomella parva, Strain SAG 63-3" /NCGR_SAMPLE_ID=MMETSP0052_2 /ASSEMBLY_ACC=CAM_ASM_000194 /LENGTH=34 /DNA_ID= /DNA_START= /DNA_END= /DNA_ORIENTATION=